MTIHRSWRILVVEDDPMIRDATMRVLMRHGYEVDVASDRTEAFQHLAERSCDVVVTDFAMPHTDGLQLLQSVHQLDSTLPVIMVTGSPTVFSRASALGAFRCFEKPPDMTHFLAAVTDAISHRRRRADARPSGRAPNVDPSGPRARNTTGEVPDDG